MTHIVQKPFRNFFSRVCSNIYVIFGQTSLAFTDIVPYFFDKYLHLIDHACNKYSFSKTKAIKKIFITADESANQKQVKKNK